MSEQKQTTGEIQEIHNLILGIRSGKLSRNKNFYTLAKSREYNRFKRAKLLISLLDDLDQTALVAGSDIHIESIEDGFFVFLYNPLLRYNRRVCVSQRELKLLSSLTASLPVP